MKKKKKMYPWGGSLDEKPAAEAVHSVMRKRADAWRSGTRAGHRQTDQR